MLWQDIMKHKDSDLEKILRPLNSTDFSAVISNFVRSHRKPALCK